MFDKYAPKTLEKSKTLREIAKYLENNPKTSIDNIRGAIRNQLLERGVIGEQTKSQYGGTMKYNIDMHDDDYLLINECIYDLLYERVITPGVNAHNLNLPQVHVSDKDKLEKYL